MGMGKRGVRLQEKGRVWRIPGLLYADDYVLCGDSEEDLRAIVGRLVEVCRRGLKVNAGKRKVMLLGGEEWLECEVCVNGMRLRDKSISRNLNIWDVFWAYQVHMRQSVVGGG